MRAEHVIRRDPSSAEAAEDHRDLHRLAAKFVRRCAKTDLTGAQLFQMRRKRVTHFCACLKAVLGFVLNGVN